MDESVYPPTIAATVQVCTGDRLEVTAFRVGVCTHGYVQYELAWSDGSPLNVQPVAVQLALLPPRSAVVVRL